MIQKYVLSLCSMIFICISLNGQLSCIGTLNLSLNISGMATLTPAILLSNPLDPAYTYTLSKSNFNCADIGSPQSIIVYQRLGGALINSCMSTVVVEDKNLPPVCSAAIACLANVNVSLDATGSATIRPEALISGPLNPIYTYTLSKSTFNCADIGTPQTVIVSQFLGGFFVNSCYTTVIVEDKNLPAVCSAPTLVCRADVVISLNSDGTATLSPADVLLLPLEPSFTYSVSPSSFDCSDIGSHRAVVSVTTSAGATNSCIFNVTIVDRRIAPPLCIALLFERIRFIPDLFWNYPVPPLTILSFEANLSTKVAEKKPKGDLIFAISTDENLDSKDLIVFEQSIKYNKKKGIEPINGKFIIPGKLKPGKYFLLGDVMSNKKKVDISFETYVQEFVVGTPNQNLIIPGSNLSNTSAFAYPNPFSSIINLRSEQNPIKEVQVFNLMGQNVRSIKLNQSVNYSYEMDLGDLQKGMYLIRVTDDTGAVTATTVIKEE